MSTGGHGSYGPPAAALFLGLLDLVDAVAQVGQVGLELRDDVAASSVCAAEIVETCFELVELARELVELARRVAGATTSGA